MWGNEARTDLWESIETANGSIDLSTGMITDDNPITTGLNCLDRVFGTLDTLEQEWTTVRQVLPFLDQPKLLELADHETVGRRILAYFGILSQV